MKITVSQLPFALNYANLVYDLTMVKARVGRIILTIPYIYDYNDDY